MVANLAFNYMNQTNGAGAFNDSSVGYVQGLATEDPLSRNSQAGGVITH